MLHFEASKVAMLASVGSMPKTLTRRAMRSRGGSAVAVAKRSLEW